MRPSDPPATAPAADPALWNDVCLASAYFHRAQTLHGKSDAAPATIDADASSDAQLAAGAAERSLELYQSCLRRVKQHRRSQSSAALMTSTSEASSKAQSFTVNLELRMAQTLRFLALVHAASQHAPNNVAENSNADEKDGGDARLEAAIKYHDMAVSLLVGVFDEEEKNQNEQAETARQYSGSINNNTNSEGREPQEQEVEEPEEVDIWSVESFSEGDQMESTGRVMLTITVPNDGKLQQPGRNAPAQAQFLYPTEDERVRAIAVSLNALAELHARCGDDRAAMSSYREALEILRAATEEEEGEESTNDDEAGRWSSDNDSRGVDAPGSISGQTYQKQVSSLTATTAISPVQSDLANTLMNVGAFHLRRDELDAALNAFSTVWALHSGNALDGQDEAETNSHIPGTPPSARSTGGVPLPYLNTPRTPATSSSTKSVGTPTLQSSFATPNTSDNDNNNRPTPTSAGALAALNNLGLVHERRSELAEALSCFEYVHSVRSEQLGREHVDTVNCLTNIGNCRQRLGEWDTAGAAYEEAVEVYRNMSRRRTMMMRADNEQSPLESSDAALRLHRSLAGALRNHGTCYWKQRRTSEAIDCLNEAVAAEESIVSLLSNSDGVAVGFQDAVRQAKESKAQLLGLLGCLFLEYRLEKLKSYDKSEEAYQRAIRTYEELGYDLSHPSVVWARHNISVVQQLRAPPPPPPQAPPAKPATDNDENEVVDLDEIDSVELDKVLTIDDEDDDDSVFVGVDATSTDELDQILTEERDSLEDGAAASKPEGADENLVVDLANKPLSHEHRNISSSLLSDQGDEEAQHDAEEDEMVSQLQLQAESEEGDALEAARAHISLASHFHEKGDRESATAHYTEAHAIYSSELGDSLLVAKTLKKLADLTSEDGALDAANELYMEALDMEMAVNGQYLPETLNAAGTACLNNKCFRDAMQLHRRALQIQKNAPQENKWKMYETLVRIGDVYYSERNDLTNIRSEEGVDYAEFIQTGFLGWIANAHDMRGEYIKAIQFYEESLQIYQSRKGKEAKRETALTLNRLGSLTREMGRYDEAMDYHSKALHIQKSGSGAAKASTAETCVLMGMVKMEMGKYHSALDLYEDSLLVLKNALGEDHSSYWMTMTQIGSIHFKLSNYEKAMEVLLEAERWQLASVGGENRDTLETQALIGRVLSAIGKYEEAMDKLNDVCDRQIKLFGSQHPAIAETLTYIGECYLDQGLATEARQQFVNAYTMRKQFFGVDQIHIAASMVDIIRTRPGQPERALAIYRNALEVYKEYLSDDHVLIGRLRVYQGNSHAEMLDFSTAVERYEQARTIFEKAFGSECANDSALVEVSIGKVLLRKCDYDSAKTSFTSALNIYQQLLPEGHPKILSTMNLLDRVEKEEALCV